jgi:hypothetical protein
MPVTINSVTREGEMASGNEQNSPVKSVKEISFDHQMTQILLSIQLTQQE